jgi:hypothetical protein
VCIRHKSLFITCGDSGRCHIYLCTITANIDKLTVHAKNVKKQREVVMTGFNERR